MSTQHAVEAGTASARRVHHSRVWRLGRLQTLLLTGAALVTIVAIVLESLAPAGHAGKNVLLITIDSLPAERLGCHGYTRVINGVKQSITPNIDALAEKGTLFENCVSQSNWTLTSMASLLYCVNPTVRAREHSYDYLALAGPHHCLFGEIPSAKIDGDYNRFCVQANPYLLDGVFTAMFGTIRNVMPRPLRQSSTGLLGPEAIHGDADAVNRSALNDMDSVRKSDREFIIYLHYMDVHEPYPWRAPYCNAFGNSGKGPEDFGRLRADCLADFAKGGSAGRHAPVLAARIERLSNDYDAALMYLDSRIGELMSGIKQRGLLDETLIVFCADHGQEFGQHGNIGHGLDMHHEETHVPLIIIGGGMPAGVRVPTFVRNIDIIPTIEQYVNFYPKCDGENLFPIALGAAKGSFAADREVFSCSDYPSEANVMMKMVISPQRMKYIVTEDKAGNIAKEQLFDLAKDPDERADLAGTRRDGVAAMRNRLTEIYLRTKSTTPASADAAPSASPLVQERLRSIGYLH